MDLQKDGPGVCSKMCPASSHEENGGIRIKTEVDSDVEVEEDPMPISFPGIKAESEVSFVSVCIVKHISYMSISAS
jgi:hypothetical protein